MNNDWPAYEPRPLNVILKAWRAGFWLPEQEEEIVRRFEKSVRKIGAKKKAIGKGHPAAHPVTLRSRSHRSARVKRAK